MPGHFPWSPRTGSAATRVNWICGRRRRRRTAHSKPCRRRSTDGSRSSMPPISPNSQGADHPAQPKFLLLDRIGVPAPKPAPGWDEVEVADRDEFVARAPSAVIRAFRPAVVAAGLVVALALGWAGGWGSYHAFALPLRPPCRSSGRASRTARSAPARTAAAPLLNRIEKPRRRPRRSRRPRFPPPSEPPVEDTSLRALRLNRPLRRRSETPQRRSRPQLHRRRRRASPASAPGCRPSPYRCRRRGRPRSRVGRFARSPAGR